MLPAHPDMQLPTSTHWSPAAWDRGWLAVGDGHHLYYEQWGLSDGPVALVLHGGPGSGFTERLRAFFDPEQFRVIAFDQRGCGRSTPRGECRANTTAHLLADTEQLRQALGVNQWLVVGGSWGATLSLAYATRHRARVSGLLLRGFFWPGAAHIDDFFAGRPWRQWALQMNAASVSGRHAAARMWREWEVFQSGPATPAPTDAQLDVWCDRYRVQAHYLQHECWLNEASLGLGAMDLSDLPIQFLHGSDDRVCALDRAWRVRSWLAGSNWHTVEGAGHDPFHPAMAQAMREALIQFARTGQFSQYPAASGLPR
ncbi:MAG: hypothetical protein RIS34_538 [Pseudomonadota bacterium]